MKFADDQASSRKELFDGTILTQCDQCRDMWRERNARGIEGEPDCQNCRVDLLEENEEIASVYMLTRRQYVTAENGRVVDIFIPSVESVMGMMGVKDRIACLMKVQRLFHHFLNEGGDEG